MLTTIRFTGLAALLVTLGTAAAQARRPDIARGTPVVVVARTAGPSQAGAGQRGGRGSDVPPPPIDPTMAPAALGRALDAYLGALAAADEFAGVVLVARDGVSVYEKSYGLANRDRRTPITADARFNLASIGKAFTRAAVGQLVAAGKLALTDTIAMRIPDYPNADARVATVDQLLNHRGGIVDFFGPRFDDADKAQFGSNADYFRFVSTEPPLFPPGTQRRYCNGCYIVLGEIVARVAGMPYERYLQQHVFDPAGMTGAGFLAATDPQVATGYMRVDGALLDSAPRHGRRGSAAGGSYARAADLLAFDNAIRERRLLDAAMTGWFLGGGETTTAGRAAGPYSIAGGAPGANTALQGNGGWTVVVLGNLDPPNATRVSSALMRALGR